MSNEPVFRCPVCRAPQTLRACCRRCQADLALVVRAYRRVEFLKRQHELAQARSDHEQAADVLAELRWLKPSC